MQDRKDAFNPASGMRQLPGTLHHVPSAPSSDMYECVVCLQEFGRVETERRSPALIPSSSLILRPKFLSDQFHPAPWRLCVRQHLHLKKGVLSRVHSGFRRLRHTPCGRATRWVPSFVDGVERLRTAVLHWASGVAFVGKLAVPASGEFVWSRFAHTMMYPENDDGAVGLFQADRADLQNSKVSFGCAITDH